MRIGKSRVGLQFLADIVNSQFQANNSKTQRRFLLGLEEELFITSRLCVERDREGKEEICEICWWGAKMNLMRMLQQETSVESPRACADMKVRPHRSIHAFITMAQQRER
jgi:hypothetical protein